MILYFIWLADIVLWVSTDMQTLQKFVTLYRTENAFNSATVEDWEWISNYIQHFTGCVIT